MGIVLWSGVGWLSRGKFGLRLNQKKPARATELGPIINQDTQLIMCIHLYDLLDVSSGLAGWDGPPLGLWLAVGLA